MNRADKIRRKLATRRKEYDAMILKVANTDAYTRPGSLRR